MIIIENLVIIALAELALGYLIRMVYKQFSAENTGCASCSGCAVDDTLAKIPEIANPQN